MKDFFRRLVAGLGIGAGAAIPGVSGAAIALILHVYEDIITAVNNFRKRFGLAIKVLLPILIGIMLAVVTCVILFHLAFEYCMFVLICIFAGFLIGSFPGITDNVKGVQISKKHIISAIIGAIFVITLGVLSVILGAQGSAVSTAFLEMPIWLYFVLIPVGAVAAVALTVPGLSGSLILLIIGFYRPLMDTTVAFGKEIFSGDWSHFGQLVGMIGCFGIGCLIGVVVISKLMTLLLAKFHDVTYFAIIGDFDPLDIEKILGIPAEHSWKKGDHIRNLKQVHPSSCYEIGRCEKPTMYVEKQMRKTISILLDKIEALQEIRRTYNVEFVLTVVPYFYLDEVNPCIDPPMDVIDFCHLTRTKISIDYYIYPNRHLDDED